MSKRAAIVTGAASGIGKATVERFADDDEHEYVVGFDVDDRVTEIDDVEGMVVDVSDYDAVMEAVTVVEEYADVASLVGCAAISRDVWVGDLEPEEWGDLIAVNLTGQYTVARAVGPKMYDRGEGTIVTLSSGAGQRGSVSAGVHYSASKAGILGLTKGLAKQLAPSVRVNCVVPGLIDTPLTTDSGLWTEEEIEAFTADLPIQRLGSADEVAEVIEFLSGEGGAYMTGSVVTVDGGASLS
ncbi:SDR family NAD(P)-dependent oxidoreductase [Haladaptatus caseinilyticus]|uniref:SDR family NAD(P)-dependent oxidoreductase n=1 Tax=Haladaptatus caseinilyticus TaxID=2993314 RepID=UPI00224AD89C|nr:SDR family NAD(P)-dependent oxidoreductase [Haladaptatus caseinilyticus]